MSNKDQIRQQLWTVPVLTLTMSMTIMIDDIGDNDDNDDNYDDDEDACCSAEK